MKKIIPRKSHQIIISLSIFLISSLPLLGQTYHLNELTSREISSVNHHSSFSLKDLCRGNVPTAFLVNGQFNIKGNAAPVRIIVDPSSIELIDDADAQFEKVEIVVIQINAESDLQFKLSLKQLDHLKKLEYIYFSCTLNLCGEDDPTITCEKEQIDRMIEGKYDAEIKVVYTAEISQ